MTDSPLANKSLQGGCRRLLLSAVPQRTASSVRLPRRTDLLLHATVDLLSARYGLVMAHVAMLQNLGMLFCGEVRQESIGENAEYGCNCRKKSIFVN